MIDGITKDQPDPIAMYIIVRESLNMSPGKTAAQVGHAVELLFQGLFFSDAESVDYSYYETNGRRKIVLRADDKEWEKVKAIPFRKSLVIDAGLTEIPSGSETVIAFWPMSKSKAQGTIIKRLQTVK